jgi:hypothetical protein
VTVEVDITVFACEAHQKPFLPLPAKPPAPGGAGDRLRQVVVQPVTRLGDEFGLVGAGLFVKLAQRGLRRRFAGIDATLRHLPRQPAARHVDAPSDEDQARAVDQDDPDPGPVGRKIGAAHDGRDSTPPA